ncbi:hypothetical protein [Nocardia sp. NPDC057668]
MSKASVSAAVRAMAAAAWSVAGFELALEQVRPASSCQLGYEGS